MGLGTLGFQTDISLPRAATAAARNNRSIDGQLQVAVLGHHAVMVPLAGGLASLFTGETAHPAIGVRPVGRHHRTMDGEHVAMAGVVLTVHAIQDLYLDRTRE